MSIITLIKDTRSPVADDPGDAWRFSSAHRTLIGVTGIDDRTGTHTFKLPEQHAPGGSRVAPNPVNSALAPLGSRQATANRFWAEPLSILTGSPAVQAEGDIGRSPDPMARYGRISQGSVPGSA